MKKIRAQDVVCTIQQGKLLDELLGRIGKYDSLFHHCVFYPDPTGEQWYYEVVYYNELTVIPGEIVCNAYCDAELDELLPSSIVIKDTTVFIGMCKTEDNQFQVYYRDPRSIMSTTPLETMKASVQAKAQTLIYLLENKLIS